jgi:tetratricopeptide (TPR) repeat protein
MNRKFINIALSLLGVILGIAYSAISADAQALKPYVPLAWVAVGVGAILTVFFGLVDNIELKFISLYFQKYRLPQFKASIDELEKKVAHNPDFENVGGEDAFNRWEEIGEDLIVMSRIYNEARQQIVNLTSFIAPAMLRGRQEKRKQLIRLGRVAYRRAERLKRWDKAAIIAYYLTRAHYSLQTLSTEKGYKWVDRMRKIYDRYFNERLNPLLSGNKELHFLLLEVEGLRFADEGKRTDARVSFQKALSLAQEPDLAQKPNIARMRKNIYFHLAELADQDGNTPTTQALSFYNQALDLTSKDVPRQIFIYDKLGQLALLSEDYTQAFQYYDKLLKLAKEKSSPVSQYSAHKGLATVLLEETPSNIKEAYSHARKALEIVKVDPVKKFSEDVSSQDKAEVYEIQTLMIEIANKMYEQYCSLLNSPQTI